jgi:prophage antirepressor-like protein
VSTKTENWKGHQIRFVEREPGDWWAVLSDVADALGLSARFVARRLDKDVISKHTLPTAGGPQEMLIVNEYGIYETVFESRKPEAKAFKRWVFDMIKTLRQASGLEGFQVFRMLDKEHQKEAMAKLKAGLRHPVRIDFIKANTIANKAVSTRFGYSKKLGKDQMAPEMLVHRQPILEDTVNLMSVRDKFGLNFSVSEAIYRKYAQ